MRRAVDGGFQREGDECFHLLGRESRCLGENGDGGPVEVGKNINRQGAENPTAIGDEEGGEGHNQQAVADGESDDAVEHGASVAVAVLVPAA